VQRAHGGERAKDDEVKRPLEESDVFFTGHSSGE
jgi:hypothetical protein